MQHRFSKAERIRKRPEFLEIQGNGRRLETANFLLFVRPPRRAGEPTRIGITVSRKVGGAVTRNRVKRLVREVFRQHKSWLGPGVRVVMVAKPSAGALDFASLEGELGTVWRRRGGR